MKYAGNQLNDKNSQGAKSGEKSLKEPADANSQDKTLTNIKELAQAIISNKHGKGCKDVLKDCCKILRHCSFCHRPKAPFSALLSLYSLVFPFTVKQDTTSREYLFGGYRYPKNICMLHAYYLSMIFVVFNWFIIMFIETAFYTKTTTCNDPDLKDNDYQCYYVTDKPYHHPINCEDDPTAHVICYIGNFRFPWAVSLAYSLAIALPLS